MADGYQLLRQVEILIEKSRAARPHTGVVAKRGARLSLATRPLRAVRRAVRMPPTSLSLDGHAGFVAHYF